MTAVTNLNQIAQTSLYDNSNHRVVAWQAGPVSTDNTVNPPVNYAPAAVDVAVEVAALTSTTGTLTSVAAATSSTQLLASNTSRKGMSLFNDSTAVLYLALSGSASTTAYTTQIPANTLYEMPVYPLYTGTIYGVWASVTGNARITELS